MALPSHLKAALDELAAAPSPELVAFSLMVEEPRLRPETALRLADREGPGPRLDIVNPVEMLRLAALGYRMEQL